MDITTYVLLSLGLAAIYGVCWRIAATPRVNPNDVMGARVRLDRL